MILSAKSKNTSQLFIQSTAIFFFIGKIISLKLWLATRIFPIVPALDFLSIVPTQIHLVLLSSSLLLMIACILKPNNNYFLGGLLLIEIASCTLDQNRWQPWVYQYIFMFYVLCANRKNEKRTLQLLLIILSSTYFYTGFQKINSHFLSIVWRRTILESFFQLPTSISQTQIAIRLGYLVPILEISFGLGLLFKKLQNKIIVLLVLMHVFILVVISPWGINYNHVVYPWNMQMIVFLLLFYNKNIDVLPIFKPSKPNLNWVTLAAWIIMPAINFLGYWDYFFSSSLYSGRIDSCLIRIKNPPPNFVLAKFYEPPKHTDSANTKTIVIQNWAMQEFNTPSCPQARVYKKIKQQWAKSYPLINATFFLVDKSSNKKIITEIR